MGRCWSLANLFPPRYPCYTTTKTHSNLSAENNSARSTGTRVHAGQLIFRLNGRWNLPVLCTQRVRWNLGTLIKICPWRQWGFVPPWRIVKRVWGVFVVSVNWPTEKCEIWLGEREQKLDIFVTEYVITKCTGNSFFRFFFRSLGCTFLQLFHACRCTSVRCSAV